MLHLKLISSVCFFHILLFQNVNSLDDAPDTDSQSAANYANSSTVTRPAEASYTHRIIDDQQAQNTAAMPSTASHTLISGVGQVLAPFVPAQLRQRLLGRQQRGQIVPKQPELIVPQQLTQNVPGQPDQIEPQSPQKAEISPSNASSSTSDNNNNILLDVIIQSKQKQINPQLRQRKKFSAKKPE
uniref:Uncharacterized protein n=1 Tax=Globodera rostochiensis TaxID=31243 RepID=A0A914GS91_GLORO